MSAWAYPASAAVAGGFSLAGAAMNQPAPIPTANPWQFGLSMLLQLPGLVQSYQQVDEARKMRQEWQETMKPSNFHRGPGYGRSSGVSALVTGAGSDETKAYLKSLWNK